MDKRKRRKLPSNDIILHILNEHPNAAEQVAEFYEQYIKEMATDPVYGEDGSRTGFYYDEDLAQELRLALSESLPALRKVLVERHIENRPVIVVLNGISK